MNGLQIFQNSEFGELGVMEQAGKPYFPATACARILGYKDTTNAIKQHCRWVVKHHLPHPQSPGKMIEMNFIPEGDLYRLIAHSKLPSAERFEVWVFDEVLPSIRQTGGYREPAGTMEQLIKQLALTTAALTKVASIMAVSPVQEAECTASPVQEDVPPKRHYCKHRKRRSQSKILWLDKELREKVDEMILSGDYTYIKVAEYLRGVVFPTSISAIGRYARMLDE